MGRRWRAGQRQGGEEGAERGAEMWTRDATWGRVIGGVAARA